MLEKEDILQQFDEIEAKVEVLIENLKALEVANSDQKRKIEELEQKLQEKSEAERIYSEQKELVRAKIDGLLKKLMNFSEFES